MMHRIFYITIFICLSIASQVDGKTRFFIQTVATGDQNGKVASGGIGYFESITANKI
jgi:hypothetical protein